MTDPRPRPQYGEYADVPPPAPSPVPAPTPPTQPAATERPNRTRDVVLTTLLLLIGTWDVVTSFRQYADFPALLDTLYAEQGFGDYTSVQLASTIGIVANVLRIALLLIAIVWSLSRVRRGLIAFWVPLGAGVAAAIVLVACMSIAVLGDPALAAYIAERSAQP